MPRRPPPHDVFICHAGGDAALALTLKAALEKLGRAAFAATDDVRPGTPWHVAIPDALARARVVAVLVSRHWPQGHYNHAEVATAVAAFRADAARRIVPVLFDGVGVAALPYGLENFAPLVGDRRAVDAVARSLLAALDDVARTRVAADLSIANATLEDLEAAGADDAALATARAEVVRLKRALRAGGQLSAGDRLGGRYKLIEAVGDGGFATVWQAWDTTARRHVGVKVLHAQHARDASRRERFFRGARQMAAFDHPHVVPVHEPEAYDDGFHYFVMAWMPGGDLRAAVLDGRLDRAAGRRVLLDVASGLAAAHARGLIHRDVKPGNILLDADGRARLSDFDLVRAPDTTGGTRTGGLGTTLFAAPEAFTRAKDADARADVYGLGMTAAFILHAGPLPGWVLRKPEKLIAELDCGPALTAALHKAVEFDPDDRWPSVEAFVGAVDAAWDQPSAPPSRPPPAVTDPPGPAPAAPDPPPPHRRSLLLSLAGAGALGLVSGSAGWWLATRSDDPSAAVVPPDAAAPDAIVDAMADTIADAAVNHTTDAIPPPPDATASAARPTAGALMDPQTHYRPAMVYIPGGAFTRGSPPTEPDRERDEVRQPVRTRALWMADTPVTAAQYHRAFDRAAGDEHPATDRTWEQAISYCNRVSTRESLPPAYQKTDGRWRRVPGSPGYRLPTEAEWERACRAGADTAYAFGDDPAALPEHAWYVGNSGGRPHRVRLRAPSRWGLYDLHGNVWEWVEDRYGPYPSGDGINDDPRGPETGRKRVIRGGSYRDPARYLRCADRDAHLPDEATPWIGFRIVRDAPG